MGYNLDVNQNIYSQSAASRRQVAVNLLEICLMVFKRISNA